MQPGDEVSHLAVTGGAASVGWLVGMASAWLATRLLRPNDPAPNDADRTNRRERLVQTLVRAARALLVLSAGLSLPVVAAGLVAVPSHPGRCHRHATPVRLCPGRGMRACSIRSAESSGSCHESVGWRWRCIGGADEHGPEARTGTAGIRCENDRPWRPGSRHHGRRGSRA